MPRRSRQSVNEGGAGDPGRGGEALLVEPACGKVHKAPLVTMMKGNQAMEKQCTYLIYNEQVVRAEPGELASGLESNDVRDKISTMKKLIQLMLNGEQLGSLLMKVIQFVVPNEDKQLKKLLYLYLEAVEKRSPDGHLLPEMILICNMIRNDLNHPNEFVRGSALRFLSKIREKDILEPLVASLRVNLEHRHSYVRRNAVLAIYNTYKCFEDLMPDAPELISEFIDGESDVSAKRNAFVMLCNCDQVRAPQQPLLARCCPSMPGHVLLR